MAKEEDDSYTKARLRENLEEFKSKEITLTNFENEFRNCMSKIEIIDSVIDGNDNKLDEIHRQYKPKRKALMRVRPGAGGVFEPSHNLLLQAMTEFTDRRDMTALRREYLATLTQKLDKALQEAMGAQYASRLMDGVQDVAKQMQQSVTAKFTDLSEFYKGITSKTLMEVNNRIDRLEKDIEKRDEIIKELVKRKLVITEEDVREILTSGETDVNVIAAKVTKRLESKLKDQVDRIIDAMSDTDAVAREKAEKTETGEAESKKEEEESGNEEEAVEQEASAEEELDQDINKLLGLGGTPDFGKKGGKK